MKGKLFCVEGLDGSGKQTQSNLLYRRLKKEGFKVYKIEYPRYEEKSSALVRMYLRDKAFGDDASKVDPYVASSFYAVDRAADYYRVDKGWKKYYDEGYYIIADRFTTANMIHQAGKIKNKEERQKMLDWIENHEYDILGLPKPDKVIFLNVPPTQNKQNMKNRKKLDLHENDSKHLEESYSNAIEVAEKYGWETINCMNGDKMRTIDEIHEEVYKKTL